MFENRKIINVRILKPLSLPLFSSKKKKMDGKRSSTTTASTVVIANNNNVLMEILLLPSRSLIRFKSVSKHWYSLISVASFSHLHTLRHYHRKPQPSFLLHAAPSQFFYFSPTNMDGTGSTPSKAIIEASDPYSLHHWDHLGMILISKVLEGDNYSTWNRAMRISLSAKNKIGFVTGLIKSPSSTDVNFPSWQ
ncbi:hypothetical protein Pfo_027417 [Paulownia fortunei]|nr:hypothetical protein Pfo_027417 [Paulownia fortunei]